MLRLALRFRRALVILLMVAPASAQFPDAVDDVFSVCANGFVEANVLANDSSLGLLDCAATTIVVPPANGVAVWTAGSCFTHLCTVGLCLRYEPFPGFAGTDTLTYQISNSSGSDVATVTFDVCRTVTREDAFTICPGTTADFDVLANDNTTCGALDCATMQLVGPVPTGFSLVGCGASPCGGCMIRYAAPSTPTMGVVTVRYSIASDAPPFCDSTALLTVTLGQAPTVCGPGRATSTQTYSDCAGCPLGSTAAGWSTPGVPRLRVPKVVLGPSQELVQVRADLRMRHSGTFGIENRDTLNPCTAFVTFQAGFTVCPTVHPPGSCTVSGLCPDANVSDSAILPLASFDGVIDFGGPSGEVSSFTPADTTSTAIFSTPATLVHFTDLNPADGITEYVEFDHTTTASYGSSGCAPATSVEDFFASIEITLVYTLCAPGVPYCSGDGTVTACPCGNTSPVGAGQGCLNSSGLGGELRAGGVESISSDTLTLTANHLTGSTALFVQALTQDNGGLGTMLGDGLRCVNVPIIRLSTNPVSGGGSFYPMPGQSQISTRGAVTTTGPMARYYQVYYRNAAAFCTLDTFNLTNGLWIQWVP